MDIKKI